MARQAKIFRIITASTGEPLPGLPAFRSFSAASKERGHVQSELFPNCAVALSVGVFSA